MIYLWPFEMLFRFLVACRNFLYNLQLVPVRRLPGKVISVGNIGIGGTGKSPLVIEFAKKLILAGGRPVVLTRGYKSGLQEGEWQILRHGKVIGGVSRPEIAADEALMESMALPEAYVVVCANRHRAAQEFLKQMAEWAPTHWILDDGFQHRQIHRDIDVVVVDVRNPWGRCLPVGRFRESKSALKRASVVILTKSVSQAQSEEISKQVRLINQKCLVYEARFAQASVRQVCGDVSEASENYALVCSIANPKDVAEGLKAKGLSVTSVFAFTDHSRINPDRILQAKKNFQRVVTTEKDWARDRHSFERLGMPVFIAPITVEWQGFEPEFLTN
jgi:tetraacyldisaccharide 4'-kinase